MRFESILASLLILTGLICLTTSGTLLFGSDIEIYIRTFIQLCFWMGIPIIIAGIILFFIKRRKGDK